MSTFKKLLVIFLVFMLVVTFSHPTSAQFPLPGRYDQEDFQRIAANGFGDPMNNYAWSMGYFNGDLYVGVGRNSTWGVINGLGLPPEITDPIFQQITVPSGTPGSLEFANDMRGEIWRFGSSWERVYQASVFHPPAQPPGVYLPSEIGFRGPMATFTDKWGEEAIYTFRAVALPPNNVILKSTDGDTWERVRTPSIVCGSPPYMGNPRAMTVHDGKLYVGAGEAGENGGGPFVWATDDPVAATGLCSPTHNWELVADFSGEGPGTNTAVGALKSFNGYLYVGLDNRETGFQVWRSNDQSPDDPELGEWTKIVDYGAGDMHNWRAACMDVLDGRLYVGSLSLPDLGAEPGFMLPKGFEIIRIDTSDAWELVVGDYFPLVPSPSVSVPRVPISGWPGGFGNFFNWYCWSMQVNDGVLYIGSFDASFFLCCLPIEELIDLELIEEQLELEGVIAALEGSIDLLEECVVDECYIEAFELLLDAFDVGEPEDIDWEEVWEIFLEYFSGGDMWKTENGIIWQPITLNGFGNPDNYGFRNLVGVNVLFAGMANPSDGLEVWVAMQAVESTNSVGVGQDWYHKGQTVYATGSGFPFDTDVDVYIVNDRDWTDGDPIPDDVSSDGMNTLTSNESGDIGPTVIWPPMLTSGLYDIVIDVNQNGTYDFLEDAVDSASPGFTVASYVVGGEVYPENRLAILAPWIALAMLVISGITWFTLRRRKICS